jgi:hypothetical protein
MDLSFFSSNKEREVVELAEIKAKTTSQANKGGLFFLLSC